MTYNTWTLSALECDQVNMVCGDCAYYKIYGIHKFNNDPDKQCHIDIVVNNLRRINKPKPNHDELSQAYRSKSNSLTLEEKIKLFNNACKNLPYITIADFSELTGVNKKYSKSILEALERNGIIKSIVVKNKRRFSILIEPKPTKNQSKSIENHSLIKQSYYNKSIEFFLKNNKKHFNVNEFADFTGTTTENARYMLNELFITGLMEKNRVNKKFNYKPLLLG